MDVARGACSSELKTLESGVSSARRPCRENNSCLGRAEKEKCANVGVSPLKDGGLEEEGSHRFTLSVRRFLFKQPEIKHSHADAVREKSVKANWEGDLPSPLHASNLRPASGFVLRRNKNPCIAILREGGYKR